MRILFVDDDSSQVESLEDAVTAWNKLNAGRQYSVVTEPDALRAKAGLENFVVDAALFDLRIPASSGSKPAARNGNELARAALVSAGMPIAVISGDPADLDQDLEQHPLLQRFNKGDEGIYTKVLEWLDGLWSLMELVADTRRQIRKSGAEIFATRLWPRWREFTGLPAVDQTELGQIVTRQYASHIADSLGTDAASNVSWHPYEAYIQPALLNRPHTGDIFELDGAWLIVLSPQCDMANGNIKEVLMANIDISLPDNWERNLAQLSDGALDDKKAEARDNYFRKYVSQNIGNAKHFLPPLRRGDPPLTVMFSRLTLRPFEELAGRLNARKASVSGAFLPNLIQRFGAYISRTGQPDIAPKHFQ